MTQQEISKQKRKTRGKYDDLSDDDELDLFNIKKKASKPVEKSFEQLQP